MSILKELRYVIRLLGDIIHPKVKLICKGGGRGEIIVIKLLLLNRKSKPLDLKMNKGVQDFQIVKYQARSVSLTLGGKCTEFDNASLQKELGIKKKL